MREKLEAEAKLEAEKKMSPEALDLLARLPDLSYINQNPAWDLADWSWDESTYNNPLYLRNN